MLGAEIAGPYFPGCFKGDRILVCARPEELKLRAHPGDNRIRVPDLRTEPPRLTPAPKASAPISATTSSSMSPATEWTGTRCRNADTLWIEIPALALSPLTDRSAKLFFEMLSRLALCAALASLSALAQMTPQQIQTAFPPERLMSIGVYYYPEAWPESQWERDIANIKKLGFEYIHLAEFAWAFMEPEEGKYNFDWLDRVVALAQKHGLKVVLCTPSATPPAWLSTKHPEILMVNADHMQMQHGSREQADWSSSVYRRYVENIVSHMAQRYGSNPVVWGWQIDNELSHYGQGMSYSLAAQTKFRDWLREKYGTIDRLNTDWGNSFWSQMYNDFGQIRMPDKAELVANPNPHAMLDLHRWFAAEAADYLRFQAGVLRRYAKQQWITTNFMMNYDLVNPALSEHDLDILTFTMYPVQGGLFQGQLGYRMGDPAAIAFTHDFLRNLGSGVEGPMELQPGQVNWAPVNPWPQPGVIHSWIMRAFAQGGRIVCTYRYRQPLFGDELYHKGMVEPDGVTLSPGGKEFVQAIDEVNAMRPLYKPNDARARRLRRPPHGFSR